MTFLIQTSTDSEVPQYVFKTLALFLNSWQLNETRREFQGFYIIIKTLINADSTSSQPVITAIILS